ncbi:MAG: hypothetical protein P8N52_01305 [Crocinitomicaceae bacterium]|nr:hypothetical protein [Crocinitomicaceae bacterium]MDG1777060.1 hypothetical protein [Crocinitomicaceae bacterium]
MKLLLVILLFTSCGKGMGSRVVGDKLSVYYLEHSDKDKAKVIASIWRDKDLITGKKQDLQLVQFQDGYELRLIATNNIGKTQLPFNERRILLGLQRTIRDSLKLKGLQLVLCDSKFEPIYNINQ